MLFRICLLLSLCVFAIPARAELIIDVLDSNISVGGTPGFIDVMIRSRAGDTHNVSLVSYEFEISGPPIGSLEFIGTQLTTEQADSNYIFSAFQPTGGFNATVNSPTNYTGGDSTNTQNPPYDFSLVTNTNQLLVRLDVRYLLPSSTDPSQVIGTQFNISLVTANSISIFQDEFGNPIAFSSDPGVATISAVPEPSSILLTFSVGIGAFIVRRKGLRHQKSTLTRFG